MSCYTGMGHCPCVCCEVIKEELNRHQANGLSEYPIRDMFSRENILNSNMSKPEKDRALKKLSLQPENCAIYGLIHPKIHLAFACDILHMLDVGLTKDIWTLVIRWLDGKTVKGLKQTDEEKLARLRRELAAVEQLQPDVEDHFEFEDVEDHLEDKHRGSGPPIKKKKTVASKRPPRQGRAGGQQLLDRLDARAAGVERFSGWKQLKMLSELPLITGHEMKIIMQIFDILVEGLVQGEEADHVILLIQKYNEWYIALTAPTFCTEDITNLCVLGEEVASLFLSSPLVEYSKVDLQTRKFHYMFNHVIDTIRMYGCLLNTNTSLWESFHRILKKIARRSGNSAKLWIAEKTALSVSLGATYIQLKPLVPSTEAKQRRYVGVEHVNRFAGNTLILHFSSYIRFLLHCFIFLALFTYLFHLSCTFNVFVSSFSHLSVHVLIYLAHFLHCFIFCPTYPDCRSSFLYIKTGRLQE